MNIQNALDQCITTLVGKPVNTAKAYRKSLTKFACYLAEKDVSPTAPLETISIEHFIEFQSWLFNKGYSKQTIIVYYSGSKYFLDWLVIRNVLAPDYQEMLRFTMASRQARSKRESKLPRWPKRGQVETMLEAVHLLDSDSPILERNIAIIEFMAITGCRVGEIVQLQVKHLDIKDRSAVVTGKGSKERRVFFNEKTLEAITNYWKARGVIRANDPVFARHDAAAPKNKLSPLTTETMRHIVKDVARMAGIDPKLFTPHYFRHAFAIKVLNETGNLALAQDLMGHADPAATRVYAKIYPDDLRDAHKKIFG